MASKTDTLMGQLQQLINQSPSFTEEDKRRLMERLLQLNEQEMEKAITAFEWEKQQWNNIKINDTKNLEWIRDYVVLSAKKINDMARGMADEMEKKESATALQESEQFIKNL